VIANDRLKQGFKFYQFGEHGVAIHRRELDDSATGVAPIRASSLPTMSLAGMRQRWRVPTPGEEHSTDLLRSYFRKTLGALHVSVAYW
jgi:hypothetical protein